MTAPKQHLPGQVVHLTKRTTQRQFLLVNSRKGEMKNAAGYLYFLACKRHRQEPHAVMVMSNHTHLCQTDASGKRSRFLQEFHSFFAKVVNKFRKRRENLWAPGNGGNTWLLDTGKIADTMLYIWLNPVKAGLVERVDHWDHFQILPKHWGKTMRFKRPDYFREGDPDKPEFIEYTPMPPKAFSHLPLEKVITHFETLIREGEKRLLVERRKKKKTIKGMERCYTFNPESRPRKNAPMSTLNPKFSSNEPTFIEAAITGLKSFLRIYKRRMEDLKKGNRMAFPAGTLQIVERLNLDCLPIPKDIHPMEYEPYLIG